MESGLGFRGSGQHFQEVPLRRHRDVFVRSGQSVQIAQPECLFAQVHRDLLHQIVRHGREPGTQPQLVDQVQRAGVHRVTAEVSQEVGVLL
ncbi:Uncharacterised protein [Mycobacteroides abscessus subsp. abscessus]|nr:Uncharacterised protein [Mycobacteroides abscessus subsp. abscessus]